MSLTDRVYSHELDKDFWIKYPWIRPPFGFFNPNMYYLGYSALKKAITEENKSFFIDQIRNNFLPEESDEGVQERLRQTMNRGISDLNLICKKYLERDADPFIIPEVKEPFDCFNYIEAARQDWVNARLGRHNNPASKRPIDINLIFEAYQKVRSFGIGYWGLMIETSPQITNSLRHYSLILKWFQNNFGFRNPKETGIPDLSVSWESNAGVRVYGTYEHPIRSRLKILDHEKLKYSSILMKMFLDESYMGDVHDYVGLEFIVENDDEREKLIRHFHDIKVTGLLEGFKGKRSKLKMSKQSSQSFDCNKFILRPPVAIPEIIPYNTASYEKVPTEIQILTLRSHEERKINPDVQHQEYKKRQFKEVFPIWYPKEIYAPIIRLIE